MPSNRKQPELPFTIPVPLNEIAMACALQRNVVEKAMKDLKLIGEDGTPNTYHAAIHGTNVLWSPRIVNFAIPYIVYLCNGFPLTDKRQTQPAPFTQLNHNRLLTTAEREFAIGCFHRECGLLQQDTSPVSHTGLAQRLGIRPGEMKRILEGEGLYVDRNLTQLGAKYGRPLGSQVYWDQAMFIDAAEYFGEKYQIQMFKLNSKLPADQHDPFAAIVAAADASRAASTGITPAPAEPPQPTVQPTPQPAQPTLQPTPGAFDPNQTH